MTDFDEADIRTMRRQGDLREFLREQVRAGRDRRDPPSPAPPPPSGHGPGGGRPDHPEWAIRCPHCQAPPGTRCTSRARGRPLAIPSHDARHTAHARLNATQGTTT